MNINYVTIIDGGDAGYELTERWFSTIPEVKVSENCIKCYADEEIAVVAAKKFAELSKKPYVPAHTNVITSLFCGSPGSFLVFEVTSVDGHIIWHGSVMAKHSSVAEATKIAQNRGLALVLPP